MICSFHSMDLSGLEILESRTSESIARIASEWLA